MKIRSTTILSVRHKGRVAIGGDGQVTLGNTVMKADAMKIRRLLEGKVITGFAGSSADAFALLERFEAKLQDFPGNVTRAATELAKDWRTDRALRRLEALLAVVDARTPCWSPAPATSFSRPTACWESARAATSRWPRPGP